MPAAERPENDRPSRGGRWALLALVLAVGVLGVGLGTGTGRRAAGRLLAWIRGESAEAGTSYWCPMDPEIVRAGPGTCPICSMELVPAAGRVAAEPGVLRLTDRQVQLAGVRLGEVARRNLVREIDTTGRLAVDPGRHQRVAVLFPGTSVLRSLVVNSTGARVREGEVLAELENPVLAGLLAEYRAANAGYAERRAAGDGEEADRHLARRTAIAKEFATYGLSNAQVSVWAEKPKYLFTTPLFPVRAPMDGVVLADPVVVEGQPLPSGTPLVDLADLSTLWLFVDLYEHELPLVREGQRVFFSSQALPDRQLESRIRFVEPVVQERTRSVRARCRVANPDGRLAPGMFVRARILSSVPDVLAVPASAVLQTGRRDVVILSEGAGRFRPRLVDVGRRHLLPDPGEEGSGFAPSDERFHEVLAGLAPGDRVVTSGNFLLNAEAELQGLLEKMIATSEVAARAPELPDEARLAWDEVLASYLAVGTALVQDQVAPLPDLAGAILRAAHAAGELDPGGGLRRVEEAAALLADACAGDAPDLEVARRHYGSLSREVVQHLRTFDPGSVAEGHLSLFRCPMAHDYGFDLWVQEGRKLANPYMGTSMPDCGVPAEL